MSVLAERVALDSVAQPSLIDAVRWVSGSLCTTSKIYGVKL